MSHCSFAFSGEPLPYNKIKHKCTHDRFTDATLRTRLQQQRQDIPRLLQQMHAQQIPPSIAAHPGLPGLPGLGPAAGLPVPTSASAALLGLGLTPGTPSATAAAHSLSMLGKPDIHRGQPDDLKSNGGKSWLSVLRPNLALISICAAAP